MAAITETKLVFGTKGNDVLVASAQGGEHVFAAAGEDLLAAASKSNVLHGGEGNDAITITGTNNTLYGEAGEDSLVVNSGKNAVHGNEGDDRLNVAGDSNLVTGGNGDDSLFLEGSYNTVSLGWGEDQVYLTPAKISEEEDGSYGNTISLGNGDDTFQSAGNYDINDTSLRGGEGDDRIRVWGGDRNHIDGESGNDVINSLYNYNTKFIGGSGNDTIINDITRPGTNMNFDNTYYGNDGDDLFEAAGTRNKYYGGNGNDTFILSKDVYINGTDIYGDGGNDIIQADKVWLSYLGSEFNGGAGNDILNTQAGGSTLFGGSGNDVLSVDRIYSIELSGGQGQDEYVLGGNFEGPWYNTISDAGVKGEQDVVRLTNYSKEELTLYRDGDNLVFEAAEDATLRIDRFFVNGAYRIERFELGDGTVWTDSDVEKIIQGMAVAPASGAAGDTQENGSTTQELNLLLTAGGTPALL
ncbi:Ca2+-binding RTX toxin-like protein [Paenibacillus mucilaginosus]|uniref:calcium-binding protein n=1 Tax=Paenibacillus mucilaginosus TaxID=61624 RepID=UPI003D1C98FD